MIDGHPHSLDLLQQPCYSTFALLGFEVRFEQLGFQAARLRLQLARHRCGTDRKVSRSQSRKLCFNKSFVYRLLLLLELSDSNFFERGAVG